MQTRLLFVWVSHQRAFHTSLYPELSANGRVPRVGISRTGFLKGMCFVSLWCVAQWILNPLKQQKTTQKAAESCVALAQVGTLVIWHFSPRSSPQGPPGGCQLEGGAVLEYSSEVVCVTQERCFSGFKYCDLSLIHARAGQSFHSLQFRGGGELFTINTTSFITSHLEVFTFLHSKDSSTDVH